MVKISPKARAQLKHPMGKICKTLEEIKRFSYTHKIVAVGDVTTLALLGIGIRPYLAVFDFKYMRRTLVGQMKDILRREFRIITVMKNRAGTLSEEVLSAAPKLLKTGGALRIEGEEDLTALAFVKFADKNTLIAYGQPNEGIVIVEPTDSMKKKIDKILGFDKKEMKTRSGKDKSTKKIKKAVKKNKKKKN